MCGSGKFPPFKFLGDEVTLTFVSDGSGTGKGFLLRYNLTAVPIKGLRYKNNSININAK